ncbi:MAG: HAD family hydrolase, partial [Burkholderiaceae bacterium]
MHATAIRAVLVDIDGTLIDSNDAHARAWMSVLNRHGHGFPYGDIRPLIGMGGDKLLEELLGLAADSPETRALGDERGRVFLETELHRLAPTRGARALLERLRAAGLKIVVATAAQAAETAALLRQAGVDDLIDRAASSADAERSKPDPDIVRSALRKAGVRPSEALMLGDTPYDVDAAAQAGVATIALRCGGWWNDDVFAEAAALYDDPADLLASLDGSPLNAAGA